MGCSDPETLNSMSRRIIPMTQAQLHHVTHCSPCFRTFQAIPAEVRHERRFRIRTTAFACAAVIIVGAVAYFTVVVRPTRTLQMAGLATPATLDLRHCPVTSLPSLYFNATSIGTLVWN